MHKSSGSFAEAAYTLLLHGQRLQVCTEWTFVCSLCCHMLACMSLQSHAVMHVTAVTCWHACHFCHCFTTIGWFLAYVVFQWPNDPRGSLPSPNMRREEGGSLPRHHQLVWQRESECNCVLQEVGLQQTLSTVYVCILFSRKSDKLIIILNLATEW